MNPSRAAQPVGFGRLVGQSWFPQVVSRRSNSRVLRGSDLSVRVVAAWTLIEIMIVIAIVGIVMTMGIPAIYQLRKKADLRQTVADIVEVCSNARAQAILSGQTVEMSIRPQDRRLDVSGSAASAPSQSFEAARGAEALPAHNPRPRSGMSATIPDDLVIEMVDVNFVEYKEAEQARVRFHPNGTCDEMTLILRSQKNEYRKITLEVTTSLAMVDTIGSR